MDAPIETEYFDVVVLGTGVSESILAAALAKEGMSVLHLEPDDAYGDAWSSVAADDFVKWRGAEEEDGYVPPAITSQSYVCHVPARNRTSRVSVCETFGTSDLNVTVRSMRVKKEGEPRQKKKERTYMRGMCGKM